jgi:exoribonuclease R
MHIAPATAAISHAGVAAIRKAPGLRDHVGVGTPRACPVRRGFSHTVVGMPHRRVRLSVDGSALRAGFEAVRTELGVPANFPPDVLAAADRAAAAWHPAVPTALDLTDVAFLTIDPPGSMDLDQAMHISRLGTSVGGRAGYRVHYAIADVAAFVMPGDAVDLEAHVRGETLYSPDMRTPLHPPSIGEAAASLLQGQTRPALVWTIDLDADGRQVAVDVVRALVRSRARLNYAQAQQAIGAKTGEGAADGTLALLAEVGRLRQAIEVERGAVSLRLPEQEVDADGSGFRLRYRAPLPVEDWNAQISLLTGMAAAGIMLDAGVGILRTLPPPDGGAIGMLRRSAHALDVHWPHSLTYQAFIRGLDPATDTGAALLELSTRLLRGAGYTLSTRRRRRNPITARLLLRTHTQQHRCADLSIGTWANCALQRAHTSPSRLGFVKPYLRLPA